jgi:hypothetical protein
MQTSLVDNLACTVQLDFPDEHGSGFYLSVGQSIFLVAAYHVLIKGQLGLPVDAGFTATSCSFDEPANVLQINPLTLQFHGRLKLNRAQDLAAVLIGQADERAAGRNVYHPGVSVRSLSPRGLVSASLDRLQPFSAIQVGADVLALGYPANLGVEQFPQIDPATPLVRGGLVVGVSPARRTIILDCRLDPGNGGGIVVDASGSILGVVAQYVPARVAGGELVNSGYSIVVPTDAVLELLREF